MPYFYSQKPYIQDLFYLLECNPEDQHTEAQGTRLKTHLALMKELGIPLDLLFCLDEKGDAETPLIFAIKQDYLFAVHLLLEHQASPDFFNESGVFPLYCAARQGNLPIMRLLLDEYKATPNLATKKYNRTSLHMAAMKDHTDAIQCLLRHHAEINVQDSGGWTPLGYAIKFELWNAGEILLQNGANFNEKEGPLLLDHAINSKNLSLVILLIDRKVKVNDPQKLYSFLSASDQTHLRVAQLLVKYSPSTQSEQEKKYLQKLNILHVHLFFLENIDPLSIPLNVVKLFLDYSEIFYKPAAALRDIRFSDPTTVDVYLNLLKRGLFGSETVRLTDQPDERSPEQICDKFSPR